MLMNTVLKAITLTTDFGYADWFVGAMKGVILSICPRAAVVDISHGVPAGDIISGAFVIREAYSFYPAGTVHVCVVDPGVGGGRAAIAVRTGRFLFVGPDNGLMSPACSDDGIDEIISIDNPDFMLENVSTTFHGRDIFAPAAAHLAAGVPLDALGRRVEAMAALDAGSVRREGRIMEGRVIYIDHFGNLITNIHGDDISSGRVSVEVGGASVPGLFASYSSAETGGALALIGSGGYLEISVNGGSAEERLGAGSGSTVRVIIDK